VPHIRGWKKRRRKENAMTLREVPVRTTVSVVKIHGEGAFRRRIMDMGITKGSEIYVRKVAPLGDPVEITVRGYELSLRKADADSIDVTVKEGV
jgi:ferrous iron transport protein A